MTLRIINVIADTHQSDKILALAEQHNANDFWLAGRSESDTSSVNILIGAENRQKFLDALQTALGEGGTWRINILPIEGTIPAVEKVSAEKANGALTDSVSREELFDDVTQGIEANSNFLLLVVLSTITAAIGLITDNVAVLIGAMVIAPLLGPHLAFALATALGDYGLMLRALRTGTVGLSVGFAVSLIIGFFVPFDLTSHELASRTIVGFDVIFLALASGAAAALSLTTGLSAVLVGVMVAVALMPPAVAIGLTIGAGQFEMAIGAFLLLAVNMVCINLSAQVVLIAKGVQPRTWLEKRSAQQSRKLNLVVWAVSLGVLSSFVYLRSF